MQPALEADRGFGMIGLVSEYLVLGVAICVGFAGLVLFAGGRRVKAPVRTTVSPAPSKRRPS